MDMVEYNMQPNANIDEQHTRSANNGGKLVEGGESDR